MAIEIPSRLTCFCGVLLDWNVLQRGLVYRAECSRCGRKYTERKDSKGERLPIEATILLNEEIVRAYGRFKINRVGIRELHQQRDAMRRIGELVVGQLKAELDHEIELLRSEKGGG